MITLREKIRIIEVGLEDYLSSMSPTERLDFLRRAESEESISDEDTNLRVYSRVNDLLWGQLVIYEQTPLTSEKDALNRLRIILRPIDEDVFDNTDAEKEKALTQTILDLPFSYVVSLLERFEESRQKVMFNQFNGVIYNKDAVEEEEESDKSEIVKSAEEQFNSTWYWYKLTKTLSNDVFLDFQRTYKRKAMDCLVDLAYITQENKIEKARNDSQAVV